MTYRFSGQVARLYVRGTPLPGCWIRLSDVAPANATLPQNGYFQVELDHENYNALYSLALLAASERRRLQIRTKADAVPTAVAPVSYMVLDW